MLILFPSSPLDPNTVDDTFAAERDAARAAGLRTAHFDSGKLDAGDYEGALRRVPEPNRQAGKGDAETVMYRGWMLRLESYRSLWHATNARGLRLINDPEQYRCAHHLPASYEAIREFTPKTVWTSTESEIDMPALMRLLAPFGDAPVVVKDYVKSQKHYWSEACFIPRADDPEAVQRIVSKFVDLQGDTLVGGLVLREFIELEPLAIHSKSGMPLAHEYRVFFLDGRPLCTVEYWEEGTYSPQRRPPVEQFATMASKVRSRFCTMDLALAKDGRWIALELGDGQVAGLPDRLSPREFYTALAGASAC